MQKLKDFLANEKVRSVLKGAGLAVGGVIVTYGAEVVSVAIGTGAFGPMAPLVGALASVTINAVRKALQPAA